MSENKQIAVVTGGTRGIGRAITERLMSDGFMVAALYQGNEAAAKKCEEETGAKTFKVDVTKRAACVAVCQEIESTMGPIVVLVNNAGITDDKIFHKMTEEQWDRVIETNLKSYFNMCSAVVPGMRDRSYGRIVNISSVNALRAPAGQANYVASKAAILGASKVLANESVLKGITVNSVAPGYIETDMTAKIDPVELSKIVAQIPMQRMGKPAEVARVVSFLVDRESDYITGQTIHVNGGQYMP